MAELFQEVARFRDWAAATYPDGQSFGEWECGYDYWGDLHTAVFAFLDGRPLGPWSEEEMRAIVYVVARDNDIQQVSREIRTRYPSALLPIACAALSWGDREACWQFALQLGEHGVGGGEEEQLLVQYAHDKDEYVRRNALQALLNLRSPVVEELALAAWHRPDEAQQWARMMALECLYTINSAEFEALRAEAASDEQPYLSDYAKRFPRRGTTTNRTDTSE